MVETSFNEMTLATKPIAGESRAAGITRPETLTGLANKHEQWTHASLCKRKPTNHAGVSKCDFFFFLCSDPTWCFLSQR